MRLQVLICTIGAEGIARVLNAVHPRVEGVGYLVSWQQPDGDIPVPQELAERQDFQVFIHRSRGISRNRNFAISCASAPLCLMGDDDVDYSADGLQGIMTEFDACPEADIIAARYTCFDRYVKPYPQRLTDFSNAPKGYYVTAFEIAFRRNAVSGHVRFNENISIGTPVLRCGEEDVFICDARRAGLRVFVSPVTIGSHDHPTTGERDAGEEYFAMTHGAVMSHLHPLSWPARLLVHALRERRAGRWAFFPYMRACLAGIRYARRNNVFAAK